ncbi:fibrillin-2-like, partial [Diaphorina citri]|uniref:Fibrillin-2-like n=1 Tax=Diaphorina citri TaxID=121845 RepID=A0A3Q0J5W5_DIACI
MHTSETRFICQCTVDGKICSDVNECQVNPGICKGGATCLNTEGSFTCICPPGLSLDTTGTQCIDLRLETCFTDYKHGTGLSPVRGVYPKTTCCCSLVGKAWGAEEDRCDACPKFGTTQFADLCPKGPGYVDKKDINECLEFPEICTNGRCRNGLGTFSCKCNQGYTLDELGLKCIDIDECSILHGVCGDGECQNIPGSFTCNCKEGYRSTAMMQICTDIDECAETPGLCRGGQCKNTPGSYHCVCPPGHELAPDKQSCKDIDECSRTSGICSNGICENMMGTYECVCSDGYTHTQHRTSCEDIDECEDSNGDCQHICVNVPGSYNCACTTGYSLGPDLHQCHDINECNLNKRICNGGQCNNTLEECIDMRRELCYLNYTDGLCSLPMSNEQTRMVCCCSMGQSWGKPCQPCPPPGHSSLSDVFSSLNIDECSILHGVCGDGECQNIPGSFTCNCIFLFGSFTCRCKDGFVGNGLVCRDINECLTNNGGCNQNAQCINNDGSFKRSVSICDEKNQEKVIGSSICEHITAVTYCFASSFLFSEECIDMRREFKCVCDEGFRGDGYSCEDIDECTDNTNYCENGHCLNYPGSFRCECEMGFMNPDDKNEQACIDINECQMFNNLCVYGRCENTFDINECQMFNNLCVYGRCENTFGMFRCECNEGFQLDNSGDKRESRCYLDTEEEEEEEEEEEGGYGGGSRRVTCTKEIAGSTTRSTCCCSIGKAWGPQCEECPAVGSDEHKTLCPGGSGYRPNSATVVLEDINECEEHDNICENGHCTNTFGSFMCSCQDGFKLDDNECNRIPTPCRGNAQCVNSPGSYECQCPEGYKLGPTMRECIDDNECNRIPTPCRGNAQCVNSPGSYECQCPEGYKLGPTMRECIGKAIENFGYSALTCEDINECLELSNQCAFRCHNVPGSFRCICPYGYALAPDGRHCIDVDECRTPANTCKFSCKNLIGSYMCTCPPGYQQVTHSTVAIATTDTRTAESGGKSHECVDVNECELNLDSCANGRCVNLEGSYRCECERGFKLSLDGKQCLDQRLGFCYRSLTNGRCVLPTGPALLMEVTRMDCCCTMGMAWGPQCQLCPTRGSQEYTDLCLESGLTVDGRDIDECVTIPDLCEHGKCINTQGSYRCLCNKGYKLYHGDTKCRDINECEQFPGLCAHTCTNTEGSYTCGCHPGFELSSDGSGTCLDSDECATGRHICQQICVNTVGSYSCACRPGFKQDGDHCRDIDECKEEINGVAVCPKPGTCINTMGSFRCLCPRGFKLDRTGTFCLDQDECTDDSKCREGCQ